jgi:hypothetical protein
MVTAVEQAGGTDEGRAHTQAASTRPSLTACGSTLPNLDPALLSAVANKVPLSFLSPSTCGSRRRPKGRGRTSAVRARFGRSGARPRQLRRARKVSHSTIRATPLRISPPIAFGERHASRRRQLHKPALRRRSAKVLVEPGRVVRAAVWVDRPRWRADVKGRAPAAGSGRPAEVNLFWPDCSGSGGEVSGRIGRLTAKALARTGTINERVALLVLEVG